MFPTALIVFREILEIALVLSIVIAATRGVPGMARFVWLGIAGGVAGSVAVAAFADEISKALQGLGQEVFNGMVLAAAAIMVGWTVVWMKRHGKELAMHVKQVGQKVARGELPRKAVSGIVALTVLREGSEIVLFLYGIVGQTPAWQVAAGSAIGFTGAFVLGFALYYGLIKLPTKQVFAVTSWLLVFVACGMAAQSAGFFAASGHLPELASPLWDSSAWLSEGSLGGKVLHALLGYTDRPLGVQVLVYGVTLLLLVTALRFTNRTPAVNAVPSAA